MFFYYMLAGAAGGLLGGMGMGGGTLLIPILTVFLDVEQKVAQAVNLAAFIPAAIASLAVNIKNGLVDKRNVLFAIIPAAALALAGSFLAGKTASELLARFFGGFLLILAIYRIVEFFKKKKEAKEAEKEKGRGEENQSKHMINENSAKCSNDKKLNKVKSGGSSKF